MVLMYADPSHPDIYVYIDLCVYLRACARQPARGPVEGKLSKEDLRVKDHKYRVNKKGHMGKAQNNVNCVFF